MTDNERIARMLSQWLAWEERPAIGSKDRAAAEAFITKHGYATLREFAPQIGLQYCDRCDGCGWYEGGKTLQTLCADCRGTGVISMLRP